MRGGASHRKRRATPLAKKSARPYGWGTSVRRVPKELLGGACPPSKKAGSCIAPRAAALFALCAEWGPAGRCAPMKRVNIKGGWY